MPLGSGGHVPRLFSDVHNERREITGWSGLLLPDFVSVLPGKGASYGKEEFLRPSGPEVPRVAPPTSKVRGGKLPVGPGCCSLISGFASVLPGKRA